MKTAICSLAGFLLGVLINASLAGSSPVGGWPVQPRMTQQAPVVDWRECYVGTDGNLHLMPTAWLNW